MKIITVTFDIANQSFQIFNEEQWKWFVASVYVDLSEALEDSHDDEEEEMTPEYLRSIMDTEEAIERLYGDEFFWEEVGI